MDTRLIDVLWVTVSASLVFLMQAGFLCLEAGSTRNKNNINVVIKNIADLGVSVLCFWAFGFALMFGGAGTGPLDVDRLVLGIDRGVWLGVFFLFQAMFCSTAVTIVSGAVAERMRFSSYVLVSVLVSGLIYPVYGHWVWNGLERGEVAGWLGRLGFVDFAGSTVVHSVGGWVALAAVLVLGPRIGRFSPKRRGRQPISGYDVPLALLGVLLLWLGWFGFNGGSVLALDASVPGIIINTVLAGSAGLTMPLVWLLARGQQVPVAAVMNGSLAGLVAITANCHVVSASAAVFIGAVGSGVMLAAQHWLERCRIDDVVGAIPVHLAAGIWGTLAVALCGDLQRLGTGLSRAEQLRSQLLGVAIGGVWAFGLAYGALVLLNRWYPIRVGLKQEHVGLNISEHGATSDLVDLLMTMGRQARTQDLGLRVPVEPFTPIGQIARRYNQVMGALETATAQNQAIVQTASEAILTVFPQHLTIRTANPAVRKLFGRSEETLVGQPVTALVEFDAELHDSPERVAMFLQRASLAGSPYEVKGRRRSGGTFPMEVTVAATETRQDAFYTLVLRDITLRQKAQEALLDAEAKDLRSQQLEQTLRELQRTQLQLVHSEKMSSLGQLVSGIAHEINNPINFIYGNLAHAKTYVQDLLRVIHAYQAEYPEHSAELEQLLQDVDLAYVQEDLGKLLTSMGTGTERITEIVRSLRSFSHAGDAELQNMEIHAGINSTLTILARRLQETQRRSAIRLVKNYGPLPRVQCYAGQLNQVFMNLLVNAIDAIDERAVKPSSLWVPQIMISTERADADWVRVHIRDNGVGIPPEVQQRIWDPFFTTKPVGKGTGLGMSISYQIIVDRHGGHLKCLSTPGRGTHFWLELPVVQPSGGGGGG